MMVAVGCHDIIESMIRLLTSKSERVKRQACFALRNLASDGKKHMRKTCLKQTSEILVLFLNNKLFQKRKSAAIQPSDFR